MYQQENNEILIVGAGPSALALLYSLRRNGHKGRVIVFTGEKESMGILKNDIDFSDISPKLIQNKILGQVDRLNYLAAPFFNFNTLGVGGGARYWGASIGVFDDEILNKNSINIDKYKSNIEYIMELLGNYNTLKYKKITKPIDVNNAIKFDSVKFMRWDAHLAVDVSKCTKCGRCIDGCSLGAIWHPVKQDFIKYNAELIDDYIISVEQIGGVIKTICGSTGKRYEVKGDIFLALNPVSTFRILCEFSLLKRAYINSCPAFAFAYLKNKMFKFPKKVFGMGIQTFKFEKNGISIAFGNIYDGLALSRNKSLVFHPVSRLIDFIYKFASKFMMFGAGFLSSQNICTQIIMKSNHETVFKIIRPVSELKLKKIKIYLKNVFKTSSIFIFKIAPVGADLHYSDGVPEDLILEPDTGKICGLANLRLAGSANWKVLGPESPTLSFMANAYGVANAYLSES